MVILNGNRTINYLLNFSFSLKNITFEITYYKYRK